MTTQAIPLLLSRQPLPTPMTPTLIREIGVTYSMAQELRWVDDDTFAIGRWDGTLTLFGPPARPGAGPRIESAAVSPVWAGLEMITPLDPGRFATSNDASSIVVWDLSVSGLASPEYTLRYDADFGVANSGTIVHVDGSQMLVTGHANGQLLVWSRGPADSGFTLSRAIDLRSPEPVPSPHRLWNVRAIHPWRDATVLTGAEDGDLCLVSVVDGRILRRRRYNPAAQRGINDIALLDDLALVAGCSVGTDDSNTWAFMLREPAQLLPLAHIDLVADGSRPQVFNFSVELARCDGSVVFFAATEEGFLWSGEVRDDALVVLDRTRVSSSLGAVVSLQRATGILAVAGDHVHLFEISSIGGPAGQ